MWFFIFFGGEHLLCDFSRQRCIIVLMLCLTSSHHEHTICYGLSNQIVSENKQIIDCGSLAYDLCVGCICIESSAASVLYLWLGDMSRLIQENHRSTADITTILIEGCFCVIVMLKWIGLYVIAGSTAESPGASTAKVRANSPCDSV